MTFNFYLSYRCCGNVLFETFSSMKILTFSLFFVFEMIKNDSILIIFVKKSVYKIRMLQFSLQFDSGWKNINWLDNLNFTKNCDFQHRICWRKQYITNYECEIGEWKNFILLGYNNGFAFLIEIQPLKVFKRTKELTSVEKGHDKASQAFQGHWIPICFWQITPAHCLDFIAFPNHQMWSSNHFAMREPVNKSNS